MELEIFWMTKDPKTKLDHLLIEDWYIWQIKDSYKIFFKKANNRQIEKWAKNMSRAHREGKTQRARTMPEKQHTHHTSEQSGKCQLLENWHVILLLSDWKKKKEKTKKKTVPGVNVPVETQWELKVFSLFGE